MTKFEELKQRAFDKCIPLNITFELTLRCNLKCVHCYNFDREQPYLPLKKREEELSDDEVFRILGELRDEGCLYLALSGGESLVHPRILDFTRAAAELGMMVTIKSNGLLLDAEWARKLADHGAASVEISLYGARPETHDPFVKSPGAFARSTAGAAAARDAGLSVKLSYVLTRRNAGEVEQMIALGSQLAIPYTFDPQITARYDGSRTDELPVDEATLEALYRGPLRHLVPPAVENPSSVQCACARSVAGISAFGEVYPCIGAPVASGSLRRQSFHEIWTGSPQLNWIRGLRLDDFAACKSCEHIAHCRRSSGTIFANTGLYTGPAQVGDDWTCMEAGVLHRLHDEAPRASFSAGALKRHSQD